MTAAAADALSGVARLQALQEIKLLKARRDRAADTKDWALYEALHAPDHVSHNDEYGSWTSAAEMIANTKRAMQHLVTVHHSHTPDIVFEAADRASGVWAMKGIARWKQGDEDHWSIAFGHYFETYGKRDGRWVFTSRRFKHYHTRSSPGAIFPPPISEA